MPSDVSLTYTVMTDDQFTLEPWEPTDEQLVAAQFRASGYTYARTAERCGRDMRTVQRWGADPRFEALVLKMRTELMQSLEPKLARLMESAAEVLIEVMEGRLAGDDPRALLARDISRDSSFRLLRARVAEQLRAGQYAPAIEGAG